MIIGITNLWSKEKKGVELDRKIVLRLRAQFLILHFYSSK